MNQKTPKNFLHRGFLGTFLLIALLTGVSFIPGQTIGGITLRRANILADVVNPDRAEEQTALPSISEEEPLAFDEEEFAIDIEEVSEQVEAVVSHPAPEVIQTYEWEVAPDTLQRRRAIPRSGLLCDELTPIETFDSVGRAAIDRFCDTLLHARRAVRIAVMGDSFIEGDILTADLRSLLQETYGGGGAGFAPVASPLTAFRRTVKTQSKGWTAYNIMRYKTTPEPQKSNYYVSGWVCKPTHGASTRWETTDYRPCLDGATRARIFFTATADCRMEVVLNDTERRTFEISGDESVREILISSPRIGSLEMTLHSGEEGFTGYGAQFESDGAVVDNYSVRSNNGHALFKTNPAVNAQIGRMIPYDLVILQYGLNIMQSGVTVYNNYSQQVEKMISFVRECFPSAAVLVLGVSDRSVKSDHGFEPMDAIPAMLHYQRRAAQNTGAAFWPTAEAMRREGGMAEFVKNGWAAKDYTHINYLGGQRIARALFDALNTLAGEAHEREVMREVQRRRRQMLLDSMRRARIDRQILHTDTQPAGL